MARKKAAQLDREIAQALKAKRSRSRRAHATRSTVTITNRDQISDRALAALGSELDEAAHRAVAAGARGDLQYQGAGATGIVFCDERQMALP